jgi:hypothetical protein
MQLAKLLGIGKFGRAELQLFTSLKEVTWIELFCKRWEQDLTELAQFSEDSAGCTLLRLSFVPVAEQRALCSVVVIFTILFTYLSPVTNGHTSETWGSPKSSINDLHFAIFLGILILWTALLQG